jgi:hypothetical protein
MFKSRVLIAIVAVAAAASIGFPETASAQKKQKEPKKLTYDQAWKKCTPFAQQVPEWNTQGSYARGASCMRRYGHQI